MESKQKTILDLCRELPDAAAEAELRARVGELGQDVAMSVMGWTPVYVRSIICSRSRVGSFLSGHYRTREECRINCDFGYEPCLFWLNRSGNSFGKTEYNWNPLGDIADAKAATDALIAKRFSFIVETDSKPGYLASLRCNAYRDSQSVFITVRASTEEIARAACALLAAEAMREETR
jgi:hypothetical protein